MSTALDMTLVTEHHWTGMPRYDNSSSYIFSIWIKLDGMFFFMNILVKITYQLLIVDGVFAKISSVSALS